MAVPPPPSDRNQQRKDYKEPGQRDPSIRDQGISGILLSDLRCRRRDACQPVEERQCLAMTGRATLRGTAAVAVFNLAIGHFTCATNDALPNRHQANRDVRNDSFQLRQNVALQVNVSRVFWRKVNGDDEWLIKPGQCALVRDWKGITFVF